MLHEKTSDDLGKVLFVKTGEHTSVIYGTHYPNRLFVGCLPPEAGAEALGAFFSTFGNVVEAKVVLDQHGRSKRFGFVTFSNPEDVESLISGKEIYFHGKKINVGPAVKKNLDTEPSPKPVTKPVKPQVPVVNAPQHVPKTIIRRSPTEAGSPFDQLFSTNQDEFRSIWGITSQASSIWAPIDQTKPDASQEKSFSFFRQMVENNNHHQHPHQMHEHHQNYTSSAFTAFAPYSDAVRAPPGFNHMSAALFSRK